MTSHKVRNPSLIQTKFTPNTRRKPNFKVISENGFRVSDFVKLAPIEKKAKELYLIFPHESGKDISPIILYRLVERGVGNELIECE